MFKNFNWGHGIALFYVCFVGIVVTALIASFSVDRDLVVDDYYAKDIAYQQRYDKITNSITSDNVNVKVEDDNVIVRFEGSDDIKGSVLFYRASDKSQDFIKHIDGSEIIIPVADLSKGKWSVKIDWVEGDKSFYKEEIIYL
jgi:hypothetical protein